MKSIALILLIIVPVFMSCDMQGAKHPVVKTDGDFIKIPLEEVTDGKTHFFTFPYKGVNVDFFVRMDGAGNLHTHFDACYTCYGFKKGYMADGTDIVCKECDTRFRLADEVWRDNGGCVPIELPHTIRKGSVTLKVADLMRGEKLF